jgi:hypothetical protein
MQSGDATVRRERGYSLAFRVVASISLRLDRQASQNLEGGFRQPVIAVNGECGCSRIIAASGKAAGLA